MGTVYKRGRIWWIAWTDKTGQRFQKSSGSQDKTEAENLLAEQLVKLSVGKLEDLLLKSYEAKGNTSRPRWHHIEEHFSGTDMKKVGRREILQFRDKLQQKGLKRATVNNQLAYLRRSLRLAQDWELIDKVPSFRGLMLAPKNTRKGFLSEEEQQRLLAELPSDAWRGLAEAAFITGWRKSELLSRTTDHVGDGVLRLEPGETKNGEGREFPLIDRLQRAIETAQADGGQKLFPITQRRFYEDWRAATEEADLEGLLFHDYRRTAARNLLKAGVSETAAMKLMGHETPSIFRRYAIMERDLLDDAAGKLQEHLAG